MENERIDRFKEAFADLIIEHEQCLKMIEIMELEYTDEYNDIVQKLSFV